MTVDHPDLFLFLNRGGSLGRSKEGSQGIRGDIGRPRGALKEASALIFHAELKEKRVGFCYCSGGF